MNFILRLLFVAAFFGYLFGYLTPHTGFTVGEAAICCLAFAILVTLDDVRQREAKPLKPDLSEARKLLDQVEELVESFDRYTIPLECNSWADHEKRHAAGLCNTVHNTVISNGSQFDPEVINGEDRV